MSLSVMQDPGMMTSSLSIIMEDGRVVPLGPDGAVMETESPDHLEASVILETGEVSVAQSGSGMYYEEFLEKVVCFKCRFCKHLSERREELIDHLRKLHREEINLGENNRDENLLPENDITGLSFVLSDTDAPDDSDNPGKGGFLCSGCSQCFDSEPDISHHLSSSESCSNTVLRQHDSSADPNSISPSSDPDEAYKKSDTMIPEDDKLKLEQDHELRVMKCSARACGHLFKSRDQLRYHSGCHNVESTDFTCRECEERFDKWRDCATHLWREHGRDCDMLACHCGYRTMSYRMLKFHSQTHENLKLFACDVCEKRFNQLSQLKNHVVIHLDKNIAELPTWAKPKQCDICRKIFSDSKSLKKHVQAIHSKLKPYICNVCNHKSARKSMLQLHMRQHTGDKPYSCDLCNYKTGDHNALRRHKLRHTGTKPYKCSFCPYAAIQSSSLKSHVKSKHQNNRSADGKVTVPEFLSSSANQGPQPNLVLTTVPGVILVGLDKQSANQEVNEDSIVMASGNFGDVMSSM